MQKVLNDIGSVQNLQLTKLWSAKRLILVEGKDINMLKRFQDLVFPDSSEPLDGLPNMPLGGWSGWPYAVGSAMLLTNSVGEDITTYCLLDSDYFTEQVIQKRLNEAKQKNVQLHIWKRKELENYFIVPSLIHRVIEKRVERPYVAPAVEDVERAIDSICEGLKEDTADKLAHEIHIHNKANGIGYANKHARAKLDIVWQTREGRLSVVSGKDVLSKLSAWSKDKYNVSFGVSTISGEMRADDLADEIVKVLQAIETASNFPAGLSLR